MFVKIVQSAHIIMWFMRFNLKNFEPFTFYCDRLRTKPLLQLQAYLHVSYLLNWATLNQSTYRLISNEDAFNPLNKGLSKAGQAMNISEIWDILKFEKCSFKRNTHCHPYSHLPTTIFISHHFLTMNESLLTMNEEVIFFVIYTYDYSLYFNRILRSWTS